MRRFEKYLGIPFVESGRSFEGCNCYGLFRLIYKHEAGITLPTYGDISSEQLLKVARALKKAKETKATWIAVPRFQLQPLDVIVTSAIGLHSNRSFHVATYIGDGRAIHTENGSESHIVGLSELAQVRKIITTARHAELTVAA